MQGVGTAMAKWVGQVTQVFGLAARQAARGGCFQFQDGGVCRDEGLGESRKAGDGKCI